jgi:hypothetical protein
MDQYRSWDDFLKKLSVDHNLTEGAREAFLERFTRDNLEKSENEIAILVCGSHEPEQAYKKRNYFIKLPRLSFQIFLHIPCIFLKHGILSTVSGE